MAKEKKTAAEKKPKREKKLSDAMLAAIDADIEPSMIMPEGYLPSELPDRTKHYKKWALSDNVDDMYYIHSLLARNYTVSEITEEISITLLDWDRISKIGHKQAAEAEIKLEKLKGKLAKCKDEEERWKIKKEIKAQVPVKPSDYGKRLLEWLRLAIRWAIDRHSNRWKEWVSDERRRWLEDKTRSIPSAEKTYRLAMYDRLLEYEWSKPKKNSRIITEILRAIKDEVEGQRITVQWEVDDVADSIMDGSMSRDDWLDIIGVIQRMLLSSVQGEKVEDIRLLVADTFGSDIVQDAEVYVKHKKPS